MDPPNSQKSPGFAALASFFVWGLGQLYNGEVAKGLVFLSLWLLLGTAVLFFWWVFFLPVIVSFPIWVLNIYDAYASARRINTEYP